MSEQRVNSEQALQNWLTEIGFVNGNPFEESDAYFERADLPDYFHATSTYDAIVGNPLKPESKLIFAPPGSGKTAHWAMLVQESQPRKSGGRLGRVLAIPHLRFEHLWGMLPNQRITSLDHVRVLLKYGIRQFIDTLACNTDRARQFPSADLGRLRWFCDEFNPELLAADSVKQHLEKSIRKIPFQWKVFLQAVEKRNLARKLKPHIKSSVGLFFANLIDSHSRPLSSTLLADELLTEFVKLVRHADLDAVYILMDQLDAPTQVQQNPELAAKLLAPLIEDQHLMQGDGWAFKIFLPEQTRTYLFQPNTRLGDWLQQHELKIEWDKEALREMLRSRLKYFSGEKCASLDALAGSSDAKSVLPESSAKGKISNSSLKRSRTIEEDMLDKAEASPRRLLRFGKYLFEARARRSQVEASTLRSKSKEILTWGDWNQAIARLAEDTHQGPMVLRLDPDAHQIFKGPWAIPLTPKEYEFLKCLNENKGRCARETLVKRVWGPDAQGDPQVVAQLVKRIRQKIETDWKNPTYLVTERGFGFKFTLEDK